MAIIRKPLLPLKGRYGGVVFYRLPCGLICRFLTPHSRKRILKDPKFGEFRKCSRRMAKASRIGSAVYKALPEDFRQFWMYRSFVGEALKMLKDQGMTGEEVLESLFKTYVEVWYIKAELKEAEQREMEKCSSPQVRSNPVEIRLRRKEYNFLLTLNNFEPVIQADRSNKPGGYRLLQSTGMGPPLHLVKIWCN